MIFPFLTGHFWRFQPFIFRAIGLVVSWCVGVWLWNPKLHHWNPQTNSKSSSNHQFSGAKAFILRGPGTPSVPFFLATLPLKPATIALKIGHLAFQGGRKNPKGRNPRIPPNLGQKPPYPLKRWDIEINQFRPQKNPSKTHVLHVWDIYLHLPYIYAKCR